MGSPRSLGKPELCVRLQNWGMLLGDYCLSFTASCSEALCGREAICKQVSVRTAPLARIGTLKLSVLVCLLVFKRPFQHSTNWSMQSLRFILAKVTSSERTWCCSDVREHDKTFV